MARVDKTGFWTSPDTRRILYARDLRAECRNELWELSEERDKAGKLTGYQWTNVSNRFRGSYGLAGYLGVLRYLGWENVQQPNGYTRNLMELPHIPFPWGMVNGCGDSDWTYTPLKIDKGYEVSVSYPAHWDISIDDLIPERDLRDMPDEPILTGDVVAAGLSADIQPDVSDDGDVIADMADDGPTAEDLAEYYAMLDAEADRAAESDGTGIKAAPKPAAAAEPAEPAAVTRELPEVPKAPAMPAVAYATIADGMTARAFTDAHGLDTARAFRGANGRKLAYVATANGKCVVAYRARYRRGTDARLESDIAAYVTRLGYAMAA